MRREQQKQRNLQNQLGSSCCRSRHLHCLHRRFISQGVLSVSDNLISDVWYMQSCHMIRYAISIWHLVCEISHIIISVKRIVPSSIFILHITVNLYLNVSELAWSGERGKCRDLLPTWCSQRQGNRPWGETLPIIVSFWYQSTLHEDLIARCSNLRTNLKYLY